MNSQKKYDIESLLEEVITLPSIPSTIARVMQLLDDPDCSLQKVADVIALDPSLTVKVLRLVNSAFYGLSAPVASVQHAVSLLGLKVMRNLVMSATVFNQMQGHPEDFIRHSTAVGIAMRIFAKQGALQQEVESPDEAFVIGLIHDIGKTVFSTFLADDYQEVSYLAITQNLPWHEAEQHIIGADHAEMGSALAKHWKLSEGIVAAIAGHHNLDQCTGKFRTIAAHLAIADFFANQSGLSCYKKTATTAPDEAWREAGITASDVAQLLDQFFAAVPEINALLQNAQA